MNARPNLFKILTGTQDLATIAAADLFSEWSLQTGQDLTTPWPEPNLLQGTIARRQVERVSLSYTTTLHGDYQADLLFDFFSSVMWSYFVSQIFASSVNSALVTVQLPDDEYNAFVMSCTALKPRYGEQLNPVPGGYRVLLRLRGGSEVTS